MDRSVKWGRRLSIELAVIVTALLMLMPSQLASATPPDTSPANQASNSSLVALPWQNTTGAAPTGKLLGAASPTDAATVVITLNVRDPGALAQFVNNVSDPTSPSYAHFLTEQQFIQDFSPPQSVDTATASWLSGYGLHVAYTAPDHRSLFVTGNLGQFSSAFHLTFGDYREASGSAFYAPMAPPSVPTSIAPWVLSIAGLSDQKIPITDYAIHMQGLPQPQTGSQGQHTLTHDPQFHQIYQLDQLYNSTGNASAGAQPSYAVGTNVAPDLWNDTPSGGAYPCIYQTSDLNTFFNTTTHGYYAGLPAVKIQPHYHVPTYNGIAPNTNTCASLGADGEVAMDFEAAASTAPGLNLSYTWVSASNNWNAFIAMLNWLTSNDEAGANLELNAISQSWGAAEQYDCSGGPCLSTTYEADYQQLESMGVSVFASSADYDGTVGNAGTSKCSSGAANPPSLQEPGSFPYTMSVGGVGFNSALPGTTSGDDLGAQVWNWGCSGAVGAKEWIGSQGGVSALYPEASYQYGYNVNSSMAYGIAQYAANGGTRYSATSARPAPDWSGPADNLEVYVQGAWQNGYGGTSDSSPATAGLVAELDAFDGHQFGFVNPLLYSLANENLSGTLPGVPTLPSLEPTYQIQNWSNDATGQAGTGIANFHGASNYNLSAGWGIPLAWNLANLAGKPWIATNPEGAASDGTNYPIAATIQDYRPAQYVNVTYKAPGGATWSNASLSLTSGNSNKGGWTGSIPGSALTTTGTLDYCVYAIDTMEGNSWSPWNQSGWVVNGHGSAHPWELFGCNHPFTVTVNPSAPPKIPVTFLESGLPAGTNWTVTFNSLVHQSTGVNITFNVSRSNTYAYTIETPISGGVGIQSVLTSPAATGSIVVGTSHLTQAVSYQLQYHLTTSASPAAGGAVTPAGGWQNAGASVMITATPNVGYSFTSWSGNGTGSYTGTTNPDGITMSGPITEVADFTAIGAGAAPVTFLESGLPASTSWSVYLGGQVGMSTGLNITFNVTTASYPYTVPTIAFAPSAQYLPSPTSGTLSVTKHVTTAIAFTTQYYLTTSANPSSEGTVSPASGWNNAGTTPAITATPSAGYAFVSWSGTGTGSYSGTSASTIITMNGQITEIANFQAVPNTVPVSFLETGLVAGTFWSVTFNGVTASSYGLNITFNVTTSTYAYAIPVVSGGSGTQYSPAPASGSLTISKHASTPVIFTKQYYLTTSANPAAGGSATPASGWNNAGGTVTITATANGGYTFGDWSGTGTGSYSGSASSTSITMNGPITEIANFLAVPNTVPVSFLGSGLVAGTFWSVTFNGVTSSSYGLNITFNVTASTYSYAIPMVSGGSGAQYSPAPASGSLTITKHTSTSVTFTEQYYLTTSANPGAGGSATPASGWNNAGAVVTITATANGGYTFGVWSGTGSVSYSGTSASTSITMNGPITEIADFQPVPNTVPVSFLESGLVAGTFWSTTFNGVTSSSYGLNITFNVTASTYSYTIPVVSGGSGTQYSPAPATGSLTITKHTSTSVTFTEQYYLTTSTNPAAGGSATPTSGWNNAGAVVTITATANGGYTFVDWSGTGTGSYSGSASSTSITMNGPITEIANFQVFAPGTVPVTFLETGLPGGTSWSVTFNVYASTSTGQNITFNVTTSTYAYTVASVTMGAGAQYVPTPASGSLAVTNHVTQAVSFAAQYYLTTSADPSAGGTVTPSSGWYAAGTPVTITASANGGYAFTGWSGSGAGSYSGASSSVTITMNNAITEIGNFGALPSTVPVSFLESGLVAGTFWSATFNGVTASSYGMNITFNVTASTYSYSILVVSGGSGTQYSPAPASGSLTLTSHTSTSVTFTKQYYLTTSANPAAGGSAAPASGWNNAGGTVTITTTANGGYAFVDWSGTGTGSYSGTSASTSITMNGPITEIANFQTLPNTVPVSFLESGLPGGTFWSATFNGVTTSSYGLNITFNVTTSTYAYSIPTVSGGSGTQYAPSPASGSLAVTAHTSTSVTFLEQYYLTTSANPGVGGTVSPVSGWFASGASVPISATARPGYALVSWSGTGSGSYSGPSPSTTILLNGPVTETANFGGVPNTVPVSFRESGLPVGTLWSVTFNGVTASSYGQNISFNVTASTYTYSIATDSGGAGTQFAPTPSSGSLPVTGSTSQTVAFAEQYYLTLSAIPPAGGAVSPASGWNNAGSALSILATPSNGYAFVAWSGTGLGNYSGTAASATVTMNGPITEIATFESAPSTYSVTFQGTGLPPSLAWSVVFNGVTGSSTSTTIVFAGVSSGSYPYTIPNATAGAGTQFVPAPSAGMLSVSGPVTLSVSFSEEYYLTVVASPSNGGTTAPSGGWHVPGALVSISASASPGYAFLGWSGSGSGSYSGATEAVNVTMNGPVTQSANFGELFGVTFTESGLAPGTNWSVSLDGAMVTSSGTSITFDEPNATYAYSVGSPIAVSQGTRYTLTPQSGTLVVKGSTVSAPAAYTTEYHLSVSASPATDGMVTPSSGWYDSGSTLSLFAGAASGYAFSAWVGNGSGSVSGSQNPLTLTMSGPMTEQANFKPAVINGPPGPGSWISGVVSPASATVSIDNVTVTLTAAGAFNVSMGAGAHFLQATHSGYQSLDLHIVVINGSGVWLDLTLTPLSSPGTGNVTLLSGTGLALLLVALVMGLIVGLLWRKRKREEPEKHQVKEYQEPPASPP